MIFIVSSLVSSSLLVLFRVSRDCVRVCGRFLRFLSLSTSAGGVHRKELLLALLLLLLLLLFWIPPCDK